MKKMPIEELVQYYSEQRKLEYSQGKKLKHIYLHKKLHFLVIAFLKIDCILSKEKIKTLKDKHHNTNYPTIFACTHIGGNDIQRVAQIIKKSVYLMLGDPGMLYRMPAYQVLRLNGVITLETADKLDRKIAYYRSIELLNNDGSLLIYPEGAWNISPNLIVMKMFNGTVRMAKETGAEIIPIATEQYDDTFIFNIGENYKIENNDSRSVDELNNELRDKLATLKWEIFESQPQAKRNSIQKNYLSKFQDDIVKKCNYGYGFSLQDVIKERYHDKNVTEPAEAFEHLNRILPNMNTAFLFNKRLE